MARQIAGEDAYIKDANTEWFTGYHNQRVIIIDDFEPWNKNQSGWLKRLADHYPFMARVHGGQVLIRPAQTIVTSNYHPDQIWEGQPE